MFQAKFNQIVCIKHNNANLCVCVCARVIGWTVAQSVLISLFVYLFSCLTYIQPHSAFLLTKQNGNKNILWLCYALCASTWTYYSMKNGHNSLSSGLHDSIRNMTICEFQLITPLHANYYYEKIRLKPTTVYPIIFVRCCFTPLHPQAHASISNHDIPQNA